MPPATITSQSGLSRQDRRDVQVVGDHAQALVAAAARCAIASVVVPMLMISEQPFGTAARHRPGDAPLAPCVQLLALPVGDVLGGRARHAHAAVEARQQAGVGQQLARRAAPSAASRRSCSASASTVDRAARAHFVEQQGLARDSGSSRCGLRTRSSRVRRSRRGDIRMHGGIRACAKRRQTAKTKRRSSENERQTNVRIEHAASTAAERAARRAPTRRRTACDVLRRRRRHQRRRHRARPRRPRLRGRAVREGRPRRAHLVVVDQADPRRPALPRVLRVLAGAQGAGRARGAAAAARRTSCGRCAS